MTVRRWLRRRRLGNPAVEPGVFVSVQPQPHDRSPARIRRVRAIVNPASGGVGVGAVDELAAVFAEFGFDHWVSQLGPDETRTTIQAAIDAGPDLVVVLGGDGTTRLVAEMCGSSGPMVATLPGGTVNKLDRALHGQKTWRDALFGVLIGGEERWVPGGEIAGRAFYCSAVLGSPALGALAREAFRAHRFGQAWRHAASALGRGFAARLRYEFDGGSSGRAMAVGLICATISRALDEEQALEAAVLDLRNARAGLRLVFNHLVGDWRNDPDVTVGLCTHGRVWARAPIPCMLDGEFFRFDRQVEIRYRARAFRTLAPPCPEAAT